MWVYFENRENDLVVMHKGGEVKMNTNINAILEYLNMLRQVGQMFCVKLMLIKIVNLLVKLIKTPYQKI